MFYPPEVKFSFFAWGASPLYCGLAFAFTSAGNQTNLLGRIFSPDKGELLCFRAILKNGTPFGNLTAHWTPSNSGKDSLIRVFAV